MIGGVLCSFTFTRVCGILFATARKWSILPLRSARKMKKEKGGRIFEGFLKGAFFTLRKLIVRLYMVIAMLLLGKTYAFTW